MLSRPGLIVLLFFFRSHLLFPGVIAHRSTKNTVTILQTFARLFFLRFFLIMQESNHTHQTQSALIPFHSFDLSFFVLLTHKKSAKLHVASAFPKWSQNSLDILTFHFFPWIMYISWCNVFVVICPSFWPGQGSPFAGETIAGETLAALQVGFEAKTVRDDNDDDESGSIVSSGKKTLGLECVCI